MRCPSSASAAPRFTAVVVLPTPPFWLAIATIFIWGVRDLPDDVVARNKRKLNFSNFGFEFSALAFTVAIGECFSSNNYPRPAPESDWRRRRGPLAQP